MFRHMLKLPEHCAKRAKIDPTEKQVDEAAAILMDIWSTATLDVCCAVLAFAGGLHQVATLALSVALTLISPATKNIVVGSDSVGLVHCFHLGGPDVKVHLPGPVFARPVADSTRICIGQRDKKFVALIDAAKPHTTLKKIVHSQPEFLYCCIIDEKRVAISGTGKEVEIFDIETGVRTAALNGFREPVVNLLRSENFLIGASGTEIVIWNLQTGKAVGRRTIGATAAMEVTAGFVLAAIESWIMPYSIDYPSNDYPGIRVGSPVIDIQAFDARRFVCLCEDFLGLYSYNPAGPNPFVLVQKIAEGPFSTDDSFVVCDKSIILSHDQSLIVFE